MRHYQIWYSMVLAIVCLFLWSCGNDDPPTAPDLTMPLISSENTDWEIGITVSPPHKDYRNIEIFVYYLQKNSNPISEDDNVQIVIDGTTYPLEFYWEDDIEMCWNYEPNMLFNTNTAHSVKLIYNGIEKASTSIMFPTVPNCIFPESYDPRQAYTLNWTLDSSYQYQAIRLNAYSQSNDNSSTWLEFIPPANRTIQIPANTVPYYADNQYDLLLFEANLSRVDRIAFWSQSTAYRSYPEDKYSAEQGIKHQRSVFRANN